MQNQRQNEGINEKHTIGKLGHVPAFAAVVCVDWKNEKKFWIFEHDWAGVSRSNWRVDLRGVSHVRPPYRIAVQDDDRDIGKQLK